MTAARSTLRIPGFQRSLKQALSEEYRTAAAESLRREAPKPAGISDDEWLGVRTSFRILYQTASNETLDATMADVREFAGDHLSESEIDLLREILSPSPATDRRLAGVRARDAFLPNVLGSTGVVDLRVLDSSSEDGLEVAPIAVVRLDFDEHIAGQDAITFQMAGPALDELIADLETLRERVRQAAHRTDLHVRVADWAVEDA